MTMALALRPLAHELAAEIVDIDLSAKLDDATIGWIERALAAHPVLVFRDQRLGPAELAGFGKSLDQSPGDQAVAAELLGRRVADAVHLQGRL